MARKLGDADEYPPGGVIVLSPKAARAAIAEARADEDDDEEVERDLDELDELIAGDDAPTREEARRQAVVTAGGQDQAPETARAAIVSAKKRDRLGFGRGLKKIILRQDHDQWNGCYIPDGDRIEFQAKLWRKGDREQVQVILHEFGHRGQNLTGVQLFEKFKQLGLGSIDAFRRIANPVHLEDYAVTGKVDDVDGEVFAESYARFCLGVDLPQELAEFWESAS